MRSGRRASPPRGYNVVSGALVPPSAPTAAQLLAQARAVQIALVIEGCQAAIVGSFTSSALGSARSYPSAERGDRSAGAGGGGGRLRYVCGGRGEWSFASHTAAQVQQVNADWLAYRVAAQQKYANLLAQINAATTIAAVQAIAWS